MSIHRSRFLCALIASLLLAGVALATEPVRIPTENTIEDLQLFAPVESNGMSDRPYLKEGYFFTWDHTYWSVQKPRNSLVGVPGPQAVFDFNRFRVVETFSNIDTSEFKDIIHTGNRYEFGHMCDNCGWMAGMTEKHEHFQEFVHSDATVLFDDPRDLIGLAFIPSRRSPGVDADLDGDQNHGRSGTDQPTFTITPVILNGVLTSIVVTTFDGLPPFTFPNGDIPDTTGPGPVGQGDLVPTKRQFIDITVRNSTDSWSAELMSVRRLDRWFLGGHIDAFAGVRYQNFEEEFLFQGIGRPGTGLAVTAQPILDDTSIFNDADNNIVGPQIGFRWFKSCCRSTFSSELRFSPAVNFQAVRMRTLVAGQVDGPVDPLNLFSPTNQAALTFENSGNDSLHAYKFSPIGELRLNYSYQLTRAIALRAGWTATYIGGLARPSNMVIYKIPDPQIKKTDYLDDLFMQGVHVGLEINR